MNFQEIVPFTRNPNYSVHVSWKYLKKQLDEWNIDGGLDLDPEFQRGHVWTDAQRTAFVEFVLRGGAGSSQIRFNHPNWHGNYEGIMQLVDGKQRLTAVLKFLDNEVPAFGCLYKDFTGYLPHNACLQFLVNNLKTDKEVLTWYLEINAGGTPHTDVELDKVRKMLVEAGG